MRAVVHEHDRRLASPCTAIGAEQRAQLAHECICRRQRVSGSAGRAHRRALSAARADISVDRDMIARGRDGPCRAEIEAAGAADNARARMGAQILCEGDVARLIETADEVARLEHRLEHGRWIAGVGAQIAVAQVGCGEKRRLAGQVEHEIAARHRAVAGRGEVQRPARGRRRLGVAVDGELERAEIALGRADRALHHREIGHPRWRHLGRRLDQHRDVEVILEQVAGLDRPFVAAVDQDHALAAQPDERNFRRRLGGGREQRGHLGTRRIGILRPAGSLADIGVSDVGGPSRFRKQRRLLGAAHNQPLAAGRGGAEFIEFRPAQLARRRDFRAATASLHRRDVERHGVFARADQDLGRPVGHVVSGCSRGTVSAFCPRKMAASVRAAAAIGRGDGATAGPAAR